MANIEMLLSRSSSPSKRSPPAPRNRLDSTCFSDGETTQRLVATPPPDYERYLSDSELPSARYSRSPRPAFTVSRSFMRESAEDRENGLNNAGPGGGGGGEGEGGEQAEYRMMDRDNDDDMNEFGERNLLLPYNHKEMKKKRFKDKCKRWMSMTRIAALALLLLLAIIFFSIREELEEHYVLASVNRNKPHSYVTQSHKKEKWYHVRLHMRGPFYDMEYYGNGTRGSMLAAADNEHGDPTDCSTFMVICVEDNNDTLIENACDLLNTYDESRCTSVQLLSNKSKLVSGEHIDEEVITRSIEVSTKDPVTMKFLVSEDVDVHFEFAVMGEILSEKFQIVLAGLILLVVYILIVFDLVHRTVAAMIGSTLVLGVLSMLNKRPTLEMAVEWLSLETICLLFGMMILVAVFSQTGFFDYFAVKCYKLSRGKTWPLISLLCLFSAVVSAFLDNVTTILLITPVSIRLCQVLNLDPVPVLISEVLFSNIGGTGTAIGDPPNVIIVSHPLIKQMGVSFAEFTLHLIIGIIFCTITAYGVLALFYWIVIVGKASPDPPYISEMKREIAIWERTARLMPIVSLEERAVRDALRSKAREVKSQLKEQRRGTIRSAMDLWKKNLEDLESRYKITDRILLLKSTIVLAIVIIMFFFSHFIPGIEINLGWIAIFGALMLLILADIQELEGILNKVEWGTLLFFAGLFVLMEGLAELGLMEFIGKVTVDIIKQVDEDKQLLVAIVLVVWVSAIASSFIDNIPFTQAMIPVIIKLADSPEVCLPAKPLIWTLAFGACLGGNGTLIGASANVVCAGLAEQNGYKISFNGFFKMGFPMMVVTVLTANVYLIICHVAFNWNVNSC